VDVARTSLLDIAYVTAGPITGPPVILLHGWPDSASTWDAVTPALAAAGHRVIVPFLRGFGPTRFLDAGTMRSGQLAALGHDLIEFIDALALNHVALVGHDWGARAAAIATLPLRQVHNYWYHWYMALPRGEALVRDERRTFTRYIWDAWGAPGWRLDDAAFDELARAFENPDWADVTLNSYRHRWGLADGDARYQALEARLNPAPQVSVPTLVLHGANDRCNDPMTSAGKERFFSGRYERALLPGVGHFPQREDPAGTTRALLDWLR
jgi:pimeloyl-ACP methyl ester carboxylesterase